MKSFITLVPWHFRGGIHPCRGCHFSVYKRIHKLGGWLCCLSKTWTFNNTTSNDSLNPSWTYVTQCKIPTMFNDFGHTLLFYLSKAWMFNKPSPVTSLNYRNRDCFVERPSQTQVALQSETKIIPMMADWSHNVVLLKSNLNVQQIHFCCFSEP